MPLWAMLTEQPGYWPIQVSPRARACTKSDAQRLLQLCIHKVNQTQEYKWLTGGMEGFVFILWRASPEEWRQTQRSQVKSRVTCPVHCTPPMICHLTSANLLPYTPHDPGSAKEHTSNRRQKAGLILWHSYDTDGGHLRQLTHCTTLPQQKGNTTTSQNQTLLHKHTHNALWAKLLHTQKCAIPPAHGNILT